MLPVVKNKKGRNSSSAASSRDTAHLWTLKPLNRASHNITDFETNLWENTEWKNISVYVDAQEHRQWGAMVERSKEFPAKRES